MLVSCDAANTPARVARTQLGEGAVWDSANNVLLWVDIIKGKIFSTTADGKCTQYCDTRQMIGTVVPHTKECVVAATHRGICIVNRTSGRIERFLGNPEAELPENGWNDGKCDASGRLWVGSKNLFCDRPSGALWCLNGKGEWTRHVSDVGVSNGLVWTKDQKTFLYIDSPTRRIDAFDFNAKKGTLSRRRPAVHVTGKHDGYPDGSTIDADDKVWVAMWEGGCVIRYDPTSGKELLRIPIPGARQVTSCAFGGKGLSTLFVTTASCGIPQATLDRDQPNAGALFAIDLKAHGVRGVPAPSFCLDDAANGSSKPSKKRARGA